MSLMQFFQGVEDFLYAILNILTDNAVAYPNKVLVVITFGLFVYLISNILKVVFKYSGFSQHNK